MNDVERYDDPALAGRVKAWMGTAAPAAAPERLVFSVMDEVERAPRRPPWLAWRPIPATFAQYVALGLVIAIGVAGGILLSRVPEIGNKPTVAPSSPGSMPSLRLGTQIQVDGVVFARGDSGLWVATRQKQLVLLGPDGAALLDNPIDVGFIASDIAVQPNAAGGDGGSRDLVWLVSPDTDLIRFQANVGETFPIPDTAGNRVAVGAGGTWVGRADEVLKVDPGGLGVLATFPAAGHRAEDPVLVVGGELWVVDASGIQRLDPTSGALRGRLPTPADALIAHGGLVWAGQGRDLVGLDPASGEPRSTPALPVDAWPIVGLAADVNTLWVLAGPQSGRWLIGIDPGTGATRSVTPVPGGTTSIVALPGAVWTLDTDGRIGRYSPAG